MKFQNAPEMPVDLLQVNRTVALNQRGIRPEWEPIVFSWCRVATGRDRQLCRDRRGQKKLVSTLGGRESAQLGLSWVSGRRIFSLGFGFFSWRSSAEVNRACKTEWE